MDISHIVTNTFSGITSSDFSNVVLPMTLTNLHTVLAFAVCRDVQLTPTIFH